MRINVNKDIILGGVQAVIGVVNLKNTLPILSNILIDTNEKQTTLTATNLDIGMMLTINTNILEDGGITVPARRFMEIIKELPDKNIGIYTKKNNTMVIECDGVVFKILGVPKEEFPKLPTITQKEQLLIEQPVFKKMLNMTSFAISHDETRYVLNGIYFVITKEAIFTVATDGRRLVVYKQSNTTEFKTEKKVIIPIKTVQELERSLKDTGQVKITFSNNQAMFQIDELIIISRLIEGEFPSYEQAIPKESDNKLNIKTEELSAAIKRASLLTTQDSQAVRLQIQRNKLSVSKITPEIGEVWQDITAEYGGDEFVIGFNPHYLLELLRNIKQEHINIEFGGPEKPAVIRIKDEYIYVVLPMQVV